MMRLLKVCPTIVLILIVKVFLAQQPSHTHQLWDTVYDGNGAAYPLSYLKVNGSKFGNATTLSTISHTCNAGYYNLYFELGSLFGTSQSARDVACQVFRDLSNFITPTSTANIVNIYCGATSLPGALASSFFAFPAANLTTPNQGIIDGLVYKTIMSGADPYLTIPSSFHIPSNMGGNFYHGFVYANATDPWYYNTGSVSTPTNEVDFYSTILHEATHALGFISMISFNGNSVFTGFANHYGRYDTQAR